jgi:HlyD family secretion protein
MTRHTRKGLGQQPARAKGRCSAGSAGLLALTLAVGGIALPCRAGSLAASAAPVGATTLSEPIAPAVTIARAAIQEIVERILVTGTLVARDEILVGPEIEGLRIVDILVDEGDHVDKGQVMARLSRDTLDAQLAQSDATLAVADAAIEQAKSQIVQADAALAQSGPALERARDLLKTGSGTQALLEQRAAEHRTNEARLTATRDGLNLAYADKANKEALRREILVRLARTEIKAPSAGLVSRRSARRGAIATSIGEPLFRIIAGNQIELDAEVPELRLSKMAEGQKAAIAISDELVVDGTVRLISPEVDRLSRLGKLRISLPPDPRIRIGAFARATIETVRRNALGVPSSAVLFDGHQPFVQIVRDGRIVQQLVKIGLQVKGITEIASGLREGDVVVARAGAFLRDGDAVRPVEAAAAPGSAVEEAEVK